VHTASLSQLPWPPSIEIPQTMRISPPSTKPVVPNPSSAVTVVEISNPTVVVETIEVIEHARCNWNRAPCGPRGRRSLGQSDCGQKSIFARKPTRSDASTLSRTGAITWRSGVTWHQGVTATL
jgi:hypothetical protein